MCIRLSLSLPIDPFYSFRLSCVQSIDDGILVAGADGIGITDGIDIDCSYDRIIVTVKFELIFYIESLFNIL